MSFIMFHIMILFNNAYGISNLQSLMEIKASADYRAALLYYVSKADASLPAEALRRS